MTEYDDLDKLSDRLKLILGGRKKYSWGKTIGLSNGHVNRIFSESTITWEALRVIKYADNVRPHWLTGDSNLSPYLTRTTSEYEDFAEIAENYLSDGDWDVTIATDQIHITLILNQPAEYDHKGTAYAYHETVILNGPKSLPLIPLLTQVSKSKLFILNIDKATLHKLGTGWIGTYQLFGTETAPGLIQQRQPLDTQQLNQLLRTEKTDSTLIDIKLMRNVIRLLEDTLLEDGITLTPEEKSKVLAASYRQSQRLDLTSEKLNANMMRSLIEVA